MTKNLNLEHDGIHLQEPNGAVALRDFNSDYDAYIAAHCTPGAPGRLVTISTSSEDWPVWEVHPAGDEVVVVLRGKAEFIQDFSSAQRRTIVCANEAVVNPAGVPHTANVLEAFTALYITPCPGTQHLPRDPKAPR